MDILEAIHTRRSVGKVKPDEVEPEKIETILKAAVMAPNHYRTEPWKFFVLTGEGRRPLGRVLAKLAEAKITEADQAEKEEQMNRALARPFRAPVVIAVACTPDREHPKALLIEEQAAVSAAIQNMLLAAHGLGLGAIWRTGSHTYAPEMKELFGLSGEDELLGFIYLGYPEVIPPEKPREPVEKKTVWIDTDRPYV